MCQNSLGPAGAPSVLGRIDRKERAHPYSIGGGDDVTTIRPYAKSPHFFLLLPLIRK